MFKKYWIIIKNEIQRQLTHRVNVAAYALGNISELVALVVVWSVVYKNVEFIKGYSSLEMISYVIFSWFFAFLTTTYSFEEKVAYDIQLGTLSNFLVKPLNYVRYVAAISLGRISVAFCVVIMQGILVMYFFRDRFIFNIDWATIVLLGAMLIATYFINLLISILVGFIAFWTTEVSGIHSSLKVFIKFISGSYFPISLLSATFVKFSLIFPFAYTVYIPTQLYLGKISLMEGMKGLGVEIIWLFLLYGIIKVVWHYGLKKYESSGI